MVIVSPQLLSPTQRLEVATRPPKKPLPDYTFKNCPACERRDPGKIFVCSVCWPNIPGNERAALNSMRSRGQDATSKLAKCVRILKEKGCGTVAPIFR